MGLERITRYPFRRETQEWVRDQGISLHEVLTSPVYNRVVQQGLGRVTAVLGEEGLRDMTAVKEAEAIASALTYPIARMLVSAVGDLMLVRRHALREAEAVARHMANEGQDFLLELANEELGLPSTYDEGARTFTVHFTDYLKTASAIRDRAWKLYNQDLVVGRVRLGQEKFVRLLQEALRRRIESELPLDVTEEILEALSSEIAVVVEGLETLRASIQRESYGEFSLDFLPPCIADILEKIRKGVNVPHVGRFALTAFLSHVGLGVEDVIDLFRGSPDFKADLAEYQVKHILGEISGTKYSPPSCSTMNTYGICLRARECERLGHPLRYYERRQRQAARERGRAEGEATAAEGEGGTGGGEGASGEVTPGGG